MARVVIPGGTGYLGTALAEQLVARGDDVVILSRGTDPDHPGRVVQWDGCTLGDWVAELDGADAVVHLTGKRVDVRATRRNLDELIRSRVDPVLLVGEAIRQCAEPPNAWVQSSTLAIFGDTGDAVITEETPPSGVGPREMVQVALAWEAAFETASEPVQRSVLLRIGIGVGGAGDPATKRLAGIVRLGLGGAAGSGRQWVSWVHVDDLIRVMIRAIDEPEMAGLFHVAAPEPVTNAEMMRVYRSEVGRKFGLPSPAWIVKLGAPLLGTSASLALTGRRCPPRRLLDAGFVFEHLDLAEAVHDGLTRTS